MGKATDNTRKKISGKAWQWRSWEINGKGLWDPEML
jgi:uncharacterized protein YjbJ (UPF0337 family)